MEGRMKKYRQLSPERAKVWTEKSPKYQQQQQQYQPRLSNGKVPVVYYLSRNRQLEHPHFIEVPLSSPDGGLYLRDVIERLNVLRGRGMASLYSWSCKRSYKNGFVWHDLCEDDVILPAHSNEYVLKGSELFDESNAGCFSPAGNVRLSNPKLLPEPPSSRSQDDSSSSSSMNGKGTKNSQDDESSPPVQRSDSSAVSPQSSAGKSSSWNGSLSLTEYKTVYKTERLADASTQTDENASKAAPRETCTRGVSTDDGSENNGTHEIQAPQTNGSAEICRETVSPAPSSSSASSSSGARTDTLESLIRADINKLNNSFRIVEGEEFRVPKAKLKPSNVLMQLISCGSISVKDHSFGLIPTYRPSFSHSKFPSPLFSTSFGLGDLDCLPENPRFMSLRLEDKEYFSGSLIETNLPKEGVPTLLKRSSSYNADRTNKELGEDKEEKSSIGSKCIPRSIKASLNKQQQARSESMRSSPLSEGGPRMSSEGCSRTITSGTSREGSKRITEPSSSIRHSDRIDSFREEKENGMIKIEERLASGARVIIQSTGASDLS